MGANGARAGAGQDTGACRVVSRRLRRFRLSGSTRPGHRGARLRPGSRLPGRVPVHARHPADDVPRPALDDAAVRGLRDGAKSRTSGSATCSSRGRPGCPSPSTCRPRWATTPTTPSAEGEVGKVGRRHRLARGHGGAVRRDPARPGHHLDDDQRHRAASCSALYVAVGREAGASRDRLTGTIQNDILKEYIARGTYIYPPAPSLRLVTDIFEFCATRAPELEHDLASAATTSAKPARPPCRRSRSPSPTRIAYVEAARGAGLDVDEFAPRLSFFFDAHNDFFEEVAKFRAARRLWARIMRDRFGARDPRSQMLRFHTQTAGSR